MTLRDWPSHSAAFTLPMRYLLQGQGPGTVILLHGYQDHALSMTRRLAWLGQPLPFKILAVNAPFPVPIWTSEGFIEAYSWYFRDTSRDLMIVHPATSAERIAEIARLVLPPGEPVALLGFSQGGVLAPFVAQAIPSTRLIVGLGSGYAAESYSRLSRDITVQAIHGDRDDRWPLESSQAAHRKLGELGFKGGFHLIPGLGHVVEKSLDPLIRTLVAPAFGAAP